MGGKRILGVVQWVLLVALFTGCDLEEQLTRQSQDAGSDSDAAAVLSSESQSEQQPNTIASSTQQDIGLHPGKALHDANCISCHDAGKYQGHEHRVGDFPALLTQVRRCDANLNPRLADDDLVQIADYLNQAFYRYDKP